MRQAIFGAGLASLLVLAACDHNQVRLGPMREEPITVDLGSADHANIELDFGAGELNLQGGGDSLLSGTFQYNADALKPAVQSSRNGSHVSVTLKQQGHGSFGNDAKSTWSLRLNNKPLLDVAINCGAGQANLNLGEVALRTLQVHMGAGQVDLDLRGTPTRDYEVEVSGGVGQATVHLPQNVGIRADAHGGLGSIDVTGLEKTGDHYENSLYDKAKVNLRLKVEGGIGAIRILGS